MQDAVVTPLENEEYRIAQGLVLCNDNLQIERNVTYAPIYMLMFMHCKERAPQAIYDLELPDFMK